MKRPYLILICINIILMISVLILAAYYFPARQETSVYKYDYSSLKPVNEILIKDSTVSQIVQ
jgi:hypothetical protein